MWTFNFIGALGWHLWRILTLRPEIARVSDSRINLATFIAVYVVAATLKLGLAERLTPLNGLGLVLEFLVLSLAMSRGRSRMLFGFLLLTSAAFDLLVISLGFFGIWTEANLWMVAVQLGLYWHVIKCFEKSSEDVRNAGYKPPRFNSRLSA